MITALILALTGAVLFLVIRWNSARAENASLRAQIVQLKRRLSGRAR